MIFVKRHHLFLAFVAALAFCSVMVIRQYLVNQSQHINRREDFIVLHDEEKTKGAERLYQMLIQELPEVSDRALMDDDQRLAFILAQKKLAENNLLQKYRISVQNELRRRIPVRVARALEHAGGE